MPATVSATLAANEALARMRRSGTRVLPLAFGEAGLPVHPAMREKLAAAGDRNAYGPVAGCADLRKAATGYWRRRGLAADADRVVCGPGSKPLLYGLLLAIGGDVVVPRPSWVSYAAQARLLGRRPLFVPTRSGEGGVPDPEALAETVQSARAGGRDVRALVLTLPDNPTGTLARPETVEQVCALARELDLTIIADEIYRDLIFDTEAPYPCPAQYAPERTVITTALSKSLALGGWRIGIALLPEGRYGEELRTRMLAVVSEIWSSPSGPIQQAAAYAFAEPDELTEHIAKSRRLHAAMATAMADRLRAAGATVPTPHGGFYLYPDFAPLRATLTADHGVRTGADLAGLLLKEYGVGVLPGSAFGDHEEALRLRIAVSLLYGETEAQRQAALDSADPLALPWISDALDRAVEVFGSLGGAASEPANKPANKPVNEPAGAAPPAPADPAVSDPADSNRADSSDRADRAAAGDADEDGGGAEPAACAAVA